MLPLMRVTRADCRQRARCAFHAAIAVFFMCAGKDLLDAARCFTI